MTDKIKLNKSTRNKYNITEDQLKAIASKHGVSYSLSNWQVGNYAKACNDDILALMAKPAAMAVVDAIEAADEPESVSDAAPVEVGEVIEVIEANDAEAVDDIVPTLSQALVTKCGNVNYPDVFKSMPLDAALSEIGSDNHKQAIEKVRAAFLAIVDDDDKENKAIYRDLKTLLPFFSFNGIFTQRINNANFIKSSGIFLVDIDKLKGDIYAHKDIISALPECVFCFISPSGAGLKAGIRVDPDAIRNDTDFKGVYYQIEAYFADAGIVVDPACKDVRRACFVSHDPEIYVNYDAEMFVISDVVAEAPKPKAKPEPKPRTDNNTETIIINRIEKMMLGATPGNRHMMRFKTGRLLGGFIAGGLIDESKATDIISQLSDVVADGGTTDQSEGKTIDDGIECGKQSPLYTVYSEQREYTEYSQQEPQYPSFKNGTEAKAAGYFWSADQGGYIKDKSVIVADTAFSLTKFALNGSSKKMREKMLNDVFVLAQIALLGQITVIYAKPNTGKTLLTLWLLIQSIRAGRIKAEDIFYINADDTYKGLIEKLELGEEHGFNMLSPGHNGFEANDLFNYLSQLIANNTAKGKVIVLDTAKKFVDLMDKKYSSRFMISAREFASNGGTLILLAHTNKNRDADNKVVFGGTSDLVDDCDCAYTLDQTDDAGGIKTVLFENIKKRGDCSQEVGFSYTTAAGQSYLEYLYSIVCLDPEQAAFAKAAMDAAEKLLDDQAVIDAVIDALNTGDMLKTALVNAVQSAGHSKKRINEVLPAYVGTKWVLVAGGKNSHLYSLI